LELSDVDEAAPTVGGLPAPVRAVPTFEDLYREHYARMVRVALLLSGSNEVAEDIVQDAYVALWPRFERLSDPPAYLYRAVVNGWLSGRRRERVAERFRHLDVVRTVAPSEIDETWDLLARLPPRRRAAVVLRYYADLPLAEVAAVLRCRTGTVKSMLHRALAELKGEMER
jgi:RNA polymerase sigma factor (sigma-70 family)